MATSIRCTNLFKRYGGKQPVEAVRGLDLTVEAGECFGLLGPNGAGKTTTIEIIEGLAEPTGGTVEVLGILLQETRLPEKLLVSETITLFRSFYDHGPTPADVIHQVALEEKAQAR